MTNQVDALSWEKLKEIALGKSAQQKGLSFENQIEDLLNTHGISHIRIPGSSRIVKDRKSGNLITIGVPGPLDFVLFSKGKAYLIDAKSWNKDFIYRSYFMDFNRQEKTSTQIQYEKMVEVFKNSKFSDIGFVIDFNGKIRYISIRIMINTFKRKKMITSKAGIDLDKFIENVKAGK